MMQEDDDVTLGDILMLADQRRRLGGQSIPGQRPTLAALDHLQSLILKHFALLLLLKTGLGHLIELEEILELLDVRKTQWWNKIFKGNAKDKQKKKGIFNVPLEVLVERAGSDSQRGASKVQLRVPEFIEEIIATMRQMDMAVEGIFRKNGNIRRLQQISEALDKDYAQVNLSEENPVQLAALLKRFLRELPDPLLTFKLHKLFCAAASLPNIEERHRCIHLLVCLLPRYNRDTMEVLFVFLKWVASFSYKDEETGSRMDLDNLATVICPSILYSKGTDATKDDSFISIKAVQDLLENQDKYYGVPEELQFVIDENIFNIFAEDLDLPPKEIHRHCSKFMQARALPPNPNPNPGDPGMMPPNGIGVGMGGPGSRLPGSPSGRMRERPSDSRLSVHRSDVNRPLDGSSSNGSLVAGSLSMPQPYSGFRNPPTPHSPTRKGSDPNSANSDNPSTQQPRPQSANARPIRSRLVVPRSEGDLALDRSSSNGSPVAVSVSIPQQYPGFTIPLRSPPPPPRSPTQPSSDRNPAKPDIINTQNPRPTLDTRSSSRWEVPRSERTLALSGLSPDSSPVVGSAPNPQQLSGFPTPLRMPPPPPRSSSHNNADRNSANLNNIYTQPPRPLSANSRPTSYIPSHPGSASGSQHSLSLDMPVPKTQPGPQGQGQGQHRKAQNQGSKRRDWD